MFSSRQASARGFYLCWTHLTESESLDWVYGFCALLVELDYESMNPEPCWLSLTVSQWILSSVGWAWMLPKWRPYLVNSPRPTMKSSILYQASEFVTPEGGRISCSLYNKILYQILYSSLDGAWLAWKSWQNACSLGKPINTAFLVS